MSGFVLHVGGPRPYRFAVSGKVNQVSTPITTAGPLIGRPERLIPYVTAYQIRTDLVLESVNPIPRRVRRRLRRRPLGLLMADGVLFVPQTGAEWWFKVEDLYLDQFRTGRVRLATFTATTRSLKPEQIV